MGQIIEFKRKEEDLSDVCWECANCGCQAFILMIDGTVICADCETVQDNMLCGIKADE